MATFVYFVHRGSRDCKSSGEGQWKQNHAIGFKAGFVLTLWRSFLEKRYMWGSRKKIGRAV
jgi:hypothetical protein